MKQPGHPRPQTLLFPIQPPRPFPSPPHHPQNSLQPRSPAEAPRRPTRPFSRPGPIPQPTQKSCHPPKTLRNASRAFPGPDPGSIYSGRPGRAEGLPGGLRRNPTDGGPRRGRRPGYGGCWERDRRILKCGATASSDLLSFCRGSCPDSDLMTPEARLPPWIRERKAEEGPADPVRLVRWRIIGERRPFPFAGPAESPKKGPREANRGSGERKAGEGRSDRKARSDGKTGRGEGSAAGPGGEEGCGKVPGRSNPSGKDRRPTRQPACQPTHSRSGAGVDELPSKEETNQAAGPGFPVVRIPGEIEAVCWAAGSGAERSPFFTEADHDQRPQRLRQPLLQIPVAEDERTEPDGRFFCPGRTNASEEPEPNSPTPAGHEPRRGEGSGRSRETDPTTQMFPKPNQTNRRSPSGHPRPQDFLERDGRPACRQNPPGRPRTDHPLRHSTLLRTNFCRRKRTTTKNLEDPSEPANRNPAESPNKTPTTRSFPLNRISRPQPGTGGEAQPFLRPLHLLHPTRQTPEEPPPTQAPASLG